MLDEFENEIFSVFWKDDAICWGYSIHSVGQLKFLTSSGHFVLPRVIVEPPNGHVPGKNLQRQSYA